MDDDIYEPGMTITELTSILSVRNYEMRFKKGLKRRFFMGYGARVLLVWGKTATWLKQTYFLDYWSFLRVWH